MATPASTHETWRFGVYEVDTRRVELRRDGTPVKLREQSFLILIYLLENAGEIVTREELRRVLWPSDTHVDFDHSLNMAMKGLRDTLGDSTDGPLFIETVPRRGYRFIAPLSKASDLRNGRANSNGDSSSPAIEGTGGAQQALASAKSPDPRRRFGRIAAVAGLMVLAAVGAVVFLRTRSVPAHDGSQGSSAFQIVPLTTSPGIAVLPAISPSGAWIAFVWDGPERRHDNVYVQLVGSDKPLRLTDNKSGFLGGPAWSPDETRIAFTRCDGKNDGVYVVPALGGAERKLTSVGCQYNLPGPIAWLSDGAGILMIDRCSKVGQFGLVLFSLATGEAQCLTSSGTPGFENRYAFSLSPDGRTVAFIPSTDSWNCYIYTIPISGGAPHQVMEDGYTCGGPMWTPDGRSIIFASQRTTNFSLWQVSANGGAIQRETEYPSLGSFSKDGWRFVFSEQTSAEPPTIWRADLASVGGEVLSNRKMVSTLYPELDAQPSPDGARIVWTSQRTGFAEIWLSEATGQNPLQLTHLNRYSGTPRWSPDGKWIAFDNTTGESVQIFVVDVEGRNLRSIIDGPYPNVVPSWSRDGKSIYFASKRTGGMQVWRHSLDDGAEIQLTTHGGFDPFESYDGRTVYFSKFDEAGIWSVPSHGGAESLVVEGKPQTGFWGHWAVTRTGLYLLNADAEPRPRIEFYSFATHGTSPVLTLDKRPVWLQPSLSATADGKTIYYSQFDPQSVIKMMEISR